MISSANLRSLLPFPQKAGSARSKHLQALIRLNSTRGKVFSLYFLADRRLVLNGAVRYASEHPCSDAEHVRSARPVLQGRKKLHGNGIQTGATLGQTGQHCGLGQDCPPEHQSAHASRGGRLALGSDRNSGSCIRRLRQDRSQLSGKVYKRPSALSRASTSSMIRGTVLSLTPLSNPS